MERTNRTVLITIKCRLNRFRWDFFLHSSLVVVVGFRSGYVHFTGNRYDRDEWWTSRDRAHSHKHTSHQILIRLWRVKKEITQKTRNRREKKSQIWTSNRFWIRSDQKETSIQSDEWMWFRVWLCVFFSVDVVVRRVVWYLVVHILQISVVWLPLLSRAQCRAYRIKNINFSFHCRAYTRRSCCCTQIYPLVFGRVWNANQGGQKNCSKISEGREEEGEKKWPNEIETNNLDFGRFRRIAHAGLFDCVARILAYATNTLRRTTAWKREGDVINGPHAHSLTHTHTWICDEKHFVRFGSNCARAHVWSTGHVLRTKCKPHCCRRRAIERIPAARLKYYYFCCHNFCSQTQEKNNLIDTKDCNIFIVQEAINAAIAMVDPSIGFIGNWMHLSFSGAMKRKNIAVPCLRCAMFARDHRCE